VVIRNFICGVLFVGGNEAYQFLQNVYYFRWVRLLDFGMDMEQFIADCAAAIADSAPTNAVRETVARAVDDPAALEEMLGTPERGGINRIHVSEPVVSVSASIWSTMSCHRMALSRPTGSGDTYRLLTVRVF